MTLSSESRDSCTFGLCLLAVAADVASHDLAQDKDRQKWDERAHTNEEAGQEFTSTVRG